MQNMKYCQVINRIFNILKVSLKKLKEPVNSIYILNYLIEVFVVHVVLVWHKQKISLWKHLTWVGNEIWTVKVLIHQIIFLKI